MIVVVEGIDGAGKTTLARKISAQCSLEYADRDKLGHGPPTCRDEMVDRINRYLIQDNMIFDRHPVISQPIYGTMRNDESIPDELVNKFYSLKPVIIYARCVDDGLQGHRADSTADTPEHLKAIEFNYKVLLRLYDEWAFHKAMIWYRDYSETKLIASLIQGALHR